MSRHACSSTVYVAIDQASFRHMITKDTINESSSNTLAHFNITKAKDENGVEIVPEERYTNDLIRLVMRAQRWTSVAERMNLCSHPVPFKCNIRPREGCEKWLSEINV
jgi:hypothetical protein